MEPAVLSTATWTIGKALDAVKKLIADADRERADLVGRCEKLLAASQETVRGLHREVEEILLDVERLRRDPEREGRKVQVRDRIQSYLFKHDLLDILSTRIIPALKKCHSEFEKQHQRAWLPKTGREIALVDLELLIEKLKDLDSLLHEFWSAGMSGIAGSQLNEIDGLLDGPLSEEVLLKLGDLVVDARKVACEQLARSLGSEAAIIAIQRFR